MSSELLHHLENIINNYILMAQVTKPQAFEDLINDKETLDFLSNNFGAAELQRTLTVLDQECKLISKAPPVQQTFKYEEEPVYSTSTFQKPSKYSSKSFKEYDSDDSDESDKGGWEETQAFYEQLWKRKMLKAEENTTKESNEKKEKESKLVPICQDYSVGFCRFENIAHIGKCKFRHEGKKQKKFSFKLVPATTSEVNTWTTKFIQAFDSGNASVTSIQKIENNLLELMYKLKCEEIRNRRKAEDISSVEPYLFHGTSEQALNSIMTNGIYVPADYNSDPNCPVSGKIPLSICKNDCKLCTKTKHCWNNCHMYGLGAYFADKSAKSDRYVFDMNGAKDHKTGRKMLVCKVFPGKVKVIDTHLKKQDQHHDDILPPSGYDSLFAKGLGSTFKNGFSVMNSEYIIFHPYQCIPIYLITYNKA